MDTHHIDTAISELQATKTAWARLDVADKIELLGGLRDRTAQYARAWVEAAVKAKGLSMESPLAGEEWIGGPYGVIELINTLETTLRRIDAGGDVLEGFKKWSRPDGQVVIEVLPASMTDKIVFSGSSAQVWMQPEVTLDTLDDYVARFYRSGSREGAVCLVLGAGNVASIPPLDVIYKLYNEGQVCLLKMNPVNEYLGEVFEAIFEDFVDAGYLRFVYGGVDVGKYLTSHDRVDTIHITGSARTYDAIRYGSGPEGEENKAADRPINDKPISAELGGVSPTIVVPGDWSRADLKFHADNVVTQKMNNSGFNCVAAQVLILPENWELTEPFLDEIREQLRALPDRDAYYPGVADRCELATSGTGDVETFGTTAKRFLITGIDPTESDDPAFTTEFFGPALSVVTLPSADVPSYMAAATEFANDVLEGSLGGNVIVHPKTEREHQEAFDRMIADLRYGGIGINTWSAFVYLQSRCPWGAFPGNEPTNIGSGVDVVHNTLMLSSTQKAVARNPFAPSHRTIGKGELHLAPKPVFFLSNTQMHNIGEQFVEYAATGKTSSLVRVISSALLG